MCVLYFAIGHHRLIICHMLRQMVCLGRCYYLKIVVDVKTTRCYNLI